MRKIVVLFLSLILIFFLFSNNIFAQSQWGENEDNPYSDLRKGAIGISLDLLGNGLGYGLNLEFGLTNRIILGVGFSLDLFVIIIGTDYHGYLKMYLSDAPLSFYVVTSLTYFEGIFFLFFDAVESQFMILSGRIGLEWQTPIGLFLAIEGGVMTPFNRTLTPKNTFNLWVGTTIGIRF